MKQSRALILSSSRSMATAVLASVASFATANAQVVIAPNVTYDDNDTDLLDGVCDVDAVMPGPQCTLRAALENANVIGGNVSIPLAATTYSLSTWGTDDACRFGDLDVYSGTLSSLTISGVAGSTAIDAGPLAALGFPDRVLHVTPSVSSTLALEVRNVTLRGGRVGGAKGGAIWHQSGNLLLTNCAILDHQGTDGGGLRIDSRFTMNGGSVGSCAALGVSTGGGAFVQWAGLPFAQFTGVTFDGNSAQKGGALRVPAGVTVALVGSTFTDNTASGSGGAIDSSGSCSATDCSFTLNDSNSGGAVNVASSGTFTTLRTVLRSNTGQFGGAINVAGNGTANLTETTVDLNTASLNGGGLSNSGTMQLVRSTVSRNTATGGSGGGIRSFGQLTVDVSTISSNQAPAGSGGGLESVGGMPQMLSACTIAHNTAGTAGGGLHTDAVFGPPLVGLRSTILSQNRVGPIPQNFAGSVPLGSLGSNLDTDGTCALNTASDLSGTIATPMNAQLGGLQNNGGPTETHALLFCSPAIDRGSSTTIQGVLLGGDQRSAPYVGAPDTGAFEYALPFQQITPVCFGTALACPCGPGAPGHGCPTSVNPSGGLLVATGNPFVSNPTVVLHGSGMTNSFALYFQGTTTLASGLGVPFGDGLRCAGGAVIRLDLVQNSGGASSWPPSPSGWSAPQIGLVAGSTRTYQVWYRDAGNFCTTATFNLTNGVQMLWCP